MKRALTLLFVMTASLGFTQIKNSYTVGEIIVKIKPEFGEKCNKSSIQIPEIQNLIAKSSIYQVSKTFPNHKKPKQNKKSDRIVDLSTIYTFTLDPLEDRKKVIALLQQNPYVDYAEPKVLNQVTYTPNDTLNGSQWYLTAIKAFEAWDIQQGDTNVVIAFTDTGTDTDHPDMVANYAYNYNDPINGIDDDQDGYIDNFLGWDVADDDNDVGFGNSGHGINVGGLASAATDNITGLSGAGFNTKLLPVKIDQSSTGQLTGAYEGIVYAADQGAFIITNSWGSPLYSQFGQDIVNYAALNKNCLVIAATGNDKSENRFYPAAYDNVLAVGSLTSETLVKTDSRGSNYGYWTDIMAPGDNMLTTNAIGGYGTNGGTSMAAPVVAGVAGLVKAQFPNYTWQQVTEQLINTGVNIDSFNDAIYSGKIGAGIVNAFEAVKDSSSPGILFQNYSIYDNNNSTFVIGDTLRISGSFKNWLQSASNVNVTINTIDNKLLNLTNTMIIGTLNKLDSANNDSNPFTFIIPQGINFNELIEFEINITADNYNKKQYFSLVVNSDYLTVNENNLTATLLSDGGLGYASANNQLGEGIRYRGGNSLLYEGSFIIASGNNSFVGNKFRGENVSDEDFTTIQPIQVIQSKLADFEAKNTFDFNQNGVAFSVLNNVYKFKHNQAANSIIYEYVITNTSNSSQQNLYAGIIADWDVFNYQKNKVTFDPARNMGITSSTDTNLFCGVRVLTDTSITKFHYAIDNTANGSGGIDITDGFSDSEKVLALSSNRALAGLQFTEGNDVLNVNSIGPFNLNAQESFTVGFLITISDSISGLQTESDTLKQLYEQIVLSVPSKQLARDENQIKIFPNPSYGEVSVEVHLTEKTALSVAIFSIDGKLVLEKQENQIRRGLNNITLQTKDLSSGIYFIRINGKNIALQRKIIVAN